MDIKTVYAANNTYFGGNNKDFFGDIDYSTITSPKGVSYFVNYTNMWSDMLGGKKEAVYRLSSLNQTSGKIVELLIYTFKTMEEVELYLSDK